MEQGLLLQQERPAEIMREPTVMEILSSAVLKGDVGVDVIERLTKLQREQVEYQARREFNEAMHRAQEKMKRIGADALNPQTKSRYATYAKLDQVLRPIYAGEGFSLSFDTGEAPQPEMVRVKCYVSRGGHTATYQIDMPADGKGAKGGDVMTKTHATGAAASYGMRYLLKMIFNVAVGEEDDDGNLNGLEPGEADELVARVEQAGPTMEDLRAVFKDAMRRATAAKDATLVQLLTKAKDDRKKELI